MIAIKIRITVKFHNIGFGEFFLNFRSKKNLDNFAGKAFFLGQVSIFDNLLRDGAATLCDDATVFNQGQSGTGSGNPVHPRVAFKTAIFLCYVGILDVKTDLADRNIFIVTSIDQTDQLSVFAVYLGV